MSNFYGKYRGKVVNNIDPLMRGRLITLVPAVSELPLSWALPCLPYAGPGVGFFALPPIGANVWVEFEGGDPNYPIWSGCFWGDGQAPAKPAVPTTITLKTQATTLEINDLLATASLTTVTPSGPVKIEQGPGGISLTVGPTSFKITLQAVEASLSPSSLALRPDGIALQNASASANIAPGGLSIKNGAADITLSPSSIEIKNGAASVVLSPASVSLNNGALEVM
ncbi:MAG: baseplate assembly protein [Chloroflexi bacterium]|nr:baseplate assembly protein [Chloroflexota bacterium]